MSSDPPREDGSDAALVEHVELEERPRTPHDETSQLDVTDQEEPRKRMESISSTATTSHHHPLTPSVSVGTSRSQTSSVRQRRRGLPGSIDDKDSRPQSITSLDHGSPSVHSLHSLHADLSDDGFHQQIQTVICPLAQVPATQSQPVPVPVPKGLTRFSVSPVDDTITASGSLRKVNESDSLSNTMLADPSSKRESREPSIQFMMSNTSLLPIQERQLSSAADHQRLIVQDELEEEIDMKVDEEYITSDVPSEFLAFQDIINEVDENQRTIQSNFSVNTQDSATYQHAPLRCGNIQFVKGSADMAYELKKHYLCVSYDTPMASVTQFISRYWGMRNPNIMLSIISSEEHFKPWKNQRLKDDFQKGIIKAAKTTDMWIITNGIDAGIPKIIGDAIREFNVEQQNARATYGTTLSSSEQRRRRPNVIGIVPKDLVPYGVYFDGSEGVQIRNMGQKPSADIYELNPDHTHFIMVEEDWRDGGGPNLRCSIEDQFRRKQGHKKRMRLMSIGSKSDSDINHQSKHDANMPVDADNLIPIVGLLVQGAPKAMEHVLFYIQNKMPIVVLKGSGGIADMISYVQEETLEKSEADPDYEDNFMKPELMKMIMRQYGILFEDNEPAKLALRDKIMLCVKLANEGEGCCLTVVNIKGWGSTMRDLDKYILQALFKSEKQESIGQREQAQNDLQLTIDWNRPDLAWDMFQQDFTKVRIDKKMFEKALIQKDREDFIDLFLTQGVKVHKFLNHKKLKFLFEKADDREFFINVCMESVLGISIAPDQPLGEEFLSENLNRLIYKLSWVRNFIQPYELSMSSTGLYNVDANVAERKAINSLMIWAVLMNRFNLAKALWHRCDEPIGVALICSRMYRELSKYMMEQYLRTELENNAKEFGKMALGALAICWQDSSNQAYNMLGRRLPDFNNKTVIEIAYDAGYIHFLAHPCCQKWLTQKFFGHLQVKELDWGFGRLPYWFKILASVFLIFPMYLWITFIPFSKKTSVGLVGHDEDNQVDNQDDDEDDDEDIIPQVTGFEDIKPRKKLSAKIRTAMAFRRNRNRYVPFHHKIYLLWTAPITKFWLTQMFYFAFLGLFSLATIWPTCGNKILDMMVWFWAMVIEMELVCRVYRKYHKYKTISLVGNCIDVLLIMVFLVILLLTRILHTWAALSNYMEARTFMCFGLIYFFYRLLGVYLPISPTLGPMLLRISRMVTQDFVAFIRMFLIFMIVGGVTIQAVLYPNWPLSMELVKRVLIRPIYAMFLTQVQDLEGDPTCSPAYMNTSYHCQSDSMYASDDVKDLEKCPHPSFSAYVITLQYLLICKLVLVTLLFAMFSLTIAKVDEVASEVWKFQRYALIADFIERFSLPPPFTVFSFLFLLLKYIWDKCRQCKKKLARCCSNNKYYGAKKMKTRTGKCQADDTIFWKKVAREYMSNEEAKREKELLPAKQDNILLSLQEDFRTHRKSVKRLTDRVMELERMIQSSRLYLEDIAHKLEKSEVMGITNVKGRFIHIAARQSPYPATSIARFPVFDKYVPWEAPYDVYDPKTYTLHHNKFPESEVIYVDEDILELQRLHEERAGIEEDLNPLTPIPEFEPKWNAVTTYRDKGDKREIDRRSWINIDDQPLRYTIDAFGLPQNPMGRTGMRGKGILWRWGPNHVIKAVVTRWRQKYGPEDKTFLYVEGKRVMEFIGVQKDNFGDSSYSLPGDILHGLSNPYSILCRSFMRQLFNDEDTAHYNTFDQGDMVQFFSHFAMKANTSSGPSRSTSYPVDVTAAQHRSNIMQPFLTDSRPNLRTDMDEQGFDATLLYKGYLDDPRNTDNAWVEAEVWNFHYDTADTFDLRIADEINVKWKEVSPYVKMFGNESVIVQEAARIHDAYH